MRLLKNRRLHINMGNFEHIEVTATVEVDTNVDADALKAHGINPEHLEDVMSFVDEQIESFMAPDVADAAMYTDKEESFVLPYEKDRETINQKRK